MSYLAMARAFEAKLKAERGGQEQAAKAEGISTDLALSQAYRRYWELPESEPIECFQALHREIDILERQVGVTVAWRTLRETATALHAERGICPFCREPGELHLSAEQPERELRHG